MSRQMQQPTTTQCQNCLQPINTDKYPLHLAYCLRNVLLCSKCKQPYDKNDEQYQPHICALNNAQNNIQSPKQQSSSKPQSQNRFCQYCQLDIPIDSYSQHVSFCEARTNSCDQCGELVMNKNMAEHIVTCEENMLAKAIQESSQGAKPNRNDASDPIEYDSNRNSTFGAVSQSVKVNSNNSDSISSYYYYNQQSSNPNPIINPSIPNQYAASKTQIITGVMPNFGEPVKVVRYVHKGTPQAIGSSSSSVQGQPQRSTVRHEANVVATRQTIVKRQPVSVQEYMARKKKQQEEREKESRMDIENNTGTNTDKKTVITKKVEINAKQQQQKSQSISEQLSAQSLHSHSSSAYTRPQYQSIPQSISRTYTQSPSATGTGTYGNSIVYAQPTNTTNTYYRSTALTNQPNQRSGVSSNGDFSNTNDRNLPSTTIPDTRTTYYTSPSSSSGTHQQANSQTSYYPPYNPSQTRSERYNMGVGPDQWSSMPQPQIQRILSSGYPGGTAAQNNQEDQLLQAAIMASMGMWDGDTGTEGANQHQSARLYQEIQNQHEIQRSFSSGIQQKEQKKSQ